jgi:hypothetical protein
MVEAVKLRSMGSRALHLPPDPHINRKPNRHDDHGTESQYEKPPKHPHNASRIADGRQQGMCPKSLTNEKLENCKN